ncbi:MAG: ThuA domain-containing protein, partial [Planctomycetota bacterium]|nr:ThuA domain-containing protein [Planctomycetota bacterium]
MNNQSPLHGECDNLLSLSSSESLPNNKPAGFFTTLDGWATRLCISKIVPAFLVLLCAGLHAEIDLAPLTKAIPEKTAVTPKRQRRLLIFYLRDDAKIIQLANALFTEMGKKTGAFEAAVTKDPRMFEKDRLNVFDAVLFNNTANVERYLLKKEFRDNLLSFVEEGGGVVGLHQALNGGFNIKHENSQLNWPEYSRLLGAKFDKHSWSPNGTWPVAVEDVEHPINAAFADSFHESKGIRFVGSFRIKDELRRFRDFSRKESRVLL